MRESDEVARMRDLIAARWGAGVLGETRADTGSLGSEKARPDREMPGQSAARPTQDTANSRAVHPSHEFVGKAVRAHVDAPAPVSDNGAALPRVVWGGSPCESESSAAHDDPKTRTVPKAVARKFGKDERAFASDEQLNAYLDDLMRTCAFDRVVDLVKAQERPVAQLRQRLRRDGFPPRETEEALERGLRCGLVNDERYAEAFVASKVRAGWGAARIERTLARDGVAMPHWDAGEGRSPFDPEAERERAWQAVERRRVPEVKPVEKLARFLVGRGFSTSIAFEMARRRVAFEGEELSGVDEL